MRTWTGAVAVALAAITMGATSASAAEVRWAQPIGLSPAGDTGQGAQHGSGNRRGDVVVAWSDGQNSTRGVSWAHRPVGGSWRKGRLTRRVGSVSTAVAKNGDAAIVWDEAFEIRGLVLPIGGGTPISFTLRAPEADCTSSYAAAGFADNGELTVVWADCDTAYYSRRPAGGSFGAIRSIPSPAPSMGTLTMGVAADGTLGLAWKHYNEIFGATVPRSGPPTVTAIASHQNTKALLYDPDLGVAGLPELAMNARGDAVIGWEAAYRVFATTRPAGGAWRRPTRITNGDLTSATGAPVAIDPNGLATVAWEASSRASGHYQSGIFFSTSAIASPGWRGQRLAASRQAACTVDVASDARGAIHVAWNEYSQGCNGTAQQFAATRQPGADDFGAARRIQSANGILSPPRLFAKTSAGVGVTWVNGIPRDDAMTVEFSETNGQLPAQ